MSTNTLKKRLDKFHRVTDLFVEGREVVLEEGDEPVLVWVNKLNAFEQDEARKDGQVGRSRAQLMLEDGPEMETFELTVRDASKDVITRALAALKQNEFYVKALDDIRGEEAWKDKIDLIERGPQQMEQADASDEEVATFEKLLDAYDARIQELADEKSQEFRTDLLKLDDESLVAAYRKEYRELAGTQGFLSEYRITEIYFALRDCSGTRDENGRWQHRECFGHRDRLLDDRADVRTLPDALLVMVREAMTQMIMPPKSAGNLDAPASSSAPSGQPNGAADSTPSIPVAI